MSVVDPGNPKDVEIELAAPYERRAVGPSLACPLCFATVGRADMFQHEEWHRALADAIANVAEESRVITSLIQRKPVD